jgi:hypothetical protein
VADFAINAEKEEEFFNARKISIPDALSSQILRRVSIEGKIIQVYALIFVHF